MKNFLIKNKFKLLILIIFTIGVIFTVVSHYQIILYMLQTNILETNTWYYALSTIAQTLAAILALGGTFVIFKLDKVSERIKILKERVIELLMIFEETLIQSFDDVPEKDLASKLITKLEKIDTQKENWDVPKQKQRLIDFYKNRELIPKMQGYRAPSDNEVVSYLQNSAKRFGTDVEIVRITLSLLKRSLSLLSVTIIISILLLPIQIIFKGYDEIPLILIVIFAILSVYFQARTVWRVAYE